MKLVFAVFLVISAALLQLSVFAQGDRTVQVGYYPEPGMMNGAEPGAVKSGYAYEYLQEIASRAGWRYEYVYGRFDELYAKLTRGEIDLLPYVNYSERRAKQILFPNKAMGAERFYLAAKKRGVIDNTLSQVAGRKIGTSRGTFDRTPFVELMKARNIAYELVEYDSVPARWDGLMQGEIDYSIETSSMHQKDDIYAVYALPGEFPYHLAVTPGRGDVLAELNVAQEDLEQDDPGFLNQLKFRYFSGVPIFKMISSSAEKWLKQHDVIRIGSFEGQRPFAYRNGKGEIVGLAPDSIRLMLDELGVSTPVKWTLFDGRDSVLAALKNGQVDLIYPHYRNLSDAENEGVIISSCVFGAPFGLLYRGDYSANTLSKVASLDSRISSKYVRDEYPNSECIGCKAGWECVEKVLKGEATSAIMYLPILQQVASNYDEDLNIKVLNTPCGVCFAALPENAALVGIVNKAIPYLNGLKKNEIENRHAIVRNMNISGLQFFKKNPVYIYSAVIVLLLIALAWMQQRRKAAIRNAAEVGDALALARAANAKLSEQKSLLDYFIGSFSSAYSVNLADDTLQMLHVKPEFAHVFGEHGDQRSGMLKFIEKHIHPDDQLKMLHIIDRDYVRNRLKNETSFSFKVRELFGPLERTMRGVIIRGEDIDHVAVGFTDISEEVRSEQERQRQFQEAIRAAQTASILKGFGEMINAATWSMDVSDQDEIVTVRWSNEMRHLLGFESEKDFPDVLESWTNLIHPEDRERVLDNYQNGIHNADLGAIYNVEYRMRRKSGEYCWYHAYGRIAKKPDGTKIYYGIAADISAKKNQEKLMLGAVPISSDVLSKANIGLWAFELEEGQPPRMYHDETMLGLVGLDHQLPPEEAYHAWYDHVDKNCYQLVNDAVAKMMAGDHAEVQYPWHHPDGHTMIVRCGGIRNFSYTKGIRIEGTHQDVSEVLHYDDAEVKRRKAEAAKDQILSEITKARYGYNVTIDMKTLKCSVFKGTGCDRAVDIFDRCSDYGEVAREFFSRITDKEALRKTDELFSVDSIRKAVAEGKSGFIGSTVYPTVSENPDEQGKIGWREAELFIGTDAEGNQIANILGRNVTEEHEQADAEAQLLAAKASSEAKTKFLFSMSHDIRTPMNAIRGFTIIAKKKIDKIGSAHGDGAAAVGEHLTELEAIRDCLNKIDSSGELLLTLINSVLDMSRVEAGKAKLEENEGDVMQSFGKIESTMRTLAKVRDISLSFDFGKVTDRYVYIDFEKTSRVFLNLISNAIKYSKANGYVKVRCEQVGEKKDGRARYRYTFEDNGIGISDEFQRHVFEEFARERNSTTSGIQGTGLGLALCKSFVGLMSGTIECKSKQGEGTTFIVELPFRVREVDEATIARNSCAQDGKDNGANGTSTDGGMPSFAGKRVLLVEDNELNREVAEFLLNELGFEVENAEDGSVAVKLVKEKGIEQYDYILMDIQMPIMNGYDATKAIRAQGFRRPIIALSANAFAEDKAASLAVGMDDHVAKPIKLKELLAAFTKVEVKR